MIESYLHVWSKNTHFPTFLLELSVKNMLIALSLFDILHVLLEQVKAGFYFLCFDGNSFHPKWRKLISPKTKLISCNPKNSFLNLFSLNCIQKLFQNLHKLIQNTLNLVFQGLLLIPSSVRCKPLARRRYLHPLGHFGQSMI